MKKREEIQYRTGMIVGAVVLLAVVLYFTIRLPMDQAPDEYMRIEIPQFILKHGRLPLGTEKELINKIWGFSYGFTPYLPSLFAVLNMKIVSLFTQSEHALLFAARFEDNVAIIILWFIMGKIGRRLFHKRLSAFLLALLVCFLPSVIFIACYPNNDMIGLMSTAWVILGWLKGDQDGWSTENAIFLGSAIGVLALTYYNDYGYILCSIIFFLISAHRQKMEGKMVLQKAIIVFLTAFAIAGWFFIRNAIIHHGDFIGMNSMYAMGEQYAEDIYKPSMRNTYLHQGVSLKDFLLTTTFFQWTFCSCIGVFGYFEYWIAGGMTPYNIFFAIYGILLIYSIIKAVKKHNIRLDFIPCLILACLITLCLSIRYSYAIDWSPQGRYIISSAVAWMIWIVYGFDETENIVPSVALVCIYLGFCVFALKTGLYDGCLVKAAQETSAVLPYMNGILQRMQLNFAFYMMR